MQPQHDQAGLTSNFAREIFNQSDAVRLYRPAIVNGTRVAQDPVTGQTLPAALIGRIVPNSGNLTNGIGQGGQNGVPDRLIEDNGILFAPRFGLTYDLTGNQSFIFRLGGGIFYDRYEGNIAFDEIVNPPTTFQPTITWGRLQEVDPTNALLAPSALNAMQLSGEIPTTYNFNMGFQKKLPGGIIWDLAYVGSVAEPPAAACERQRGAVRGRVPAAEPGHHAGAQHAIRGRTRWRRTSCGPTSATATSTCACSTPTPTTTACRRRLIAASPTACS